MERYDHPSAARLEHALGGGQASGEFGQLLVDEDAQRLERPGRRMDRARTRMHNAGDDVGERARGADRRVAARSHHGTGNAARSSPSVAKIAASSSSDAAATMSAAVGPSRPMRMSSGPSWRKENPRAASSSCIEETPRSKTTPSTAS